MLDGRIDSLESGVWSLEPRIKNREASNKNSETRTGSREAGGEKRKALGFFKMIEKGECTGNGRSFFLLKNTEMGIFKMAGD